MSEYIFISYAHKDKKAVLKEISKREAQGQQFWFDREIQTGADWAECIGENLEKAKSVLYFDSRNSRASDNCKRELAFAQEHGIPVETIRLKSVRPYICLACFVALPVALLIAYKLFSGFVPDVTGKEAATGKSTIEESGFDCNTAYGYSDEYPLGYVMEQDKTGNSFSFIPVTITESLGKEENLVLMPDTIGSYISDGVRMLVNAGLLKFTIWAGPLDESEFGCITAQSAPAGYMISSENTIELTVAKDDKPLQFEFDGYTFTIENGMTFDLNNPESYGLSDAELALFNENNHHTIWEPGNYENIWLPAQNETIIKENPDACYGWVVVRDAELSAGDLFKGYSEIYVCPGITLTINGKLTDREGLSDFYVAPGGTLIFNDEVDGGLYLVNDGTTIFRKSVSGGVDGVMIANRGDVRVSGEIGRGVNLWSFYKSSLSGTDSSGGTVHDYSAYGILDASNWYEGCSGENGIGIMLDKLEKYASYKQDYTGGSGRYKIAPVFKPEDYEENYTKEFYASSYLFFIDYTVNLNRNGRGVYWEFIAAEGVTLTIESDTQSAFLVAEKGSTIIVNSDIQGHYPYCPWFVIDGTLILNGDYVWKYGTDPIYVANRGTFIVNGRFGGDRTYLYNFKGSSCSGNILPQTYVAEVDWVPDYQIYGNEPNCAIGYDEMVLRNKGYRWKYDTQEN